MLAKSIPAKKYNIKTGETLFSARNKCPELVIIPPRYTLYMQCSRGMMEILKAYSPTVQRYSIDEAFLDYTNMEEYFGDPIQAAYTIKERIKNQLGFTVNIGIGNNKLLAKMASEFEKPDKVHTLYKNEITKKMWPLPIEELFFVGPATWKKLKSRGIMTIGGLANTDPDYLQKWLKSQGLLIWKYANGLDDSLVKNDGVPIKGLGNSNTVAFDVTDHETAYQILLALSETVGMRIRNAGKCAYVLSVSIKNHHLISHSHQRKLDVPIEGTNEIYENAKVLFNEMWQGEPLRHFGIHLSSLCANDFYQLSVFATKEKENKNLDRTIDEIRLKYGCNTLIRSCFLNSNIEPLMGGVLTEEEYPMMSSIL
ncbi:DNA-directed DNA polymerase [Alkaliphilus metalliredigens QYMF]|uniref:DNA-directed DNA polymerase n=1 Tax=Alkaliphilus metalliredigens (strain QYMF) TaxID=293826 RepID=A6TP23_ALKMQ|nr:DNA polymerase IV [Alkaliphilus metalliredigens]ABR47941.1 DNA-directed DNA polymerase [Alkaliphilus metalliredigens QYMF]